MGRDSIKLLSVTLFFLITVSCVPVTTCPHYDKENITNDDYEEPEEETDDDALPDYGEGVKFWLSAQKNDYGTAVATDAFGGVFVTGVIQLQEDSGDMGRVFITKFNNSLDVLWTKFLSTTDNERSSAIAVDSGGSVYVAGITYGSIGGDFENQGDADLFLAKFNGEGEKVWARQWGSEKNDEISAISIDSEDNIYVAGGTIGELDDNMNIGGSDMFITKFNDSGTKQWTKQWGTDEGESALAIAIDSENNVIAAGVTAGEMDHCEHAEIDTEYPYYLDSFLIKLDGDGTKLWTRQWGTKYDDSAQSINISLNGDIFVLENRTAKMEWRVDDTFITFFNNEGVKKSSYELYLAPIISGYSIVNDSSGYTYISGQMFDAGSYSVFLAKTDKNGNVKSIKKINSGLKSGGSNSMDIDCYGNIFMTGSVREDMGPDGYRADAFLIKVNAEDL